MKIRNLTRALLLIVLSSFAPRPAYAFTDLLTSLGPPGMPKPMLLQYSGYVQPRPDDAADRTGVALHAGVFSLPIQQDEKNRWIVNGFARRFDVRSDARLPRGQKVPAQFWDTGVGLSYQRTMSKGRNWSVNATFGSASDKPFEAANVDTFGATGTYGFPGDVDSRWILLVNYSNNRPFLNNVPLPGFAYVYFPSRGTVWVFGAPFAMVRHTFAERWTITGSTIVPWVLRGELAYGIVPPVMQVFVAGSAAQESFFRKGRSDEKDRFFIAERKVFAGFRTPLTRQLSMEITGGYAFKRTIFEAHNYSDRKANRIDLGGTPQFGWQITGRF